MATLSFDAKEITIGVRTQNYFNIQVETDYINEVLDNFSTEEIIRNYSDLDELYEELQEYFKN